MADKPQSHEVKPGIAESGTPASTPRVSGALPIQRGLDPRDAMSEMAQRAQVIGQEAGAKVAAAMKDVLGAAAGIAGFAVESARDLVQYMVRRGQMTQDDADRLIRAAEDAHPKRAGGDRPRASASKPVAERAPTREAAPRAEPSPPPTKSAPAAKSGAAKKASASPAAAKPEKKSAPKAAADKRPAKKPTSPKKRR
jgi:hypothetical protein